LIGICKPLANPSKESKSKDKTVAIESKISSTDPLKELTEMKEIIKAMEANHAAQLNAMQNRLIVMERSQANRFQPRQNNERWQSKGPPQDQRPPNQLEATNMAHKKLLLFVELVKNFKRNPLAPYQINEQGFPETSNYVGYSRHSKFINNVGKTHPLTSDQWKQMKDLSKKKEDLKIDNVTRLYGETPTSEKILEIARYKGVTYQRKGNDSSNK
jgi:hypothetical protein